MTIEELKAALEFSPQMHEMCCRTDAAPELCQAMTKVQEAARTLLKLREKVQEDYAGVPDNIRDKVLELGAVEWGVTAKKTDEEHLSDYAETLRLTREHFKTGDKNHLNGVYLLGNEAIVCMVGTGPNSGIIAQVIVGLWNKFHAELLSRTDKAMINAADKEE